MLNRAWKASRWLCLAVVGGGLLFQSACATSLASGTAGLMTSITNEFIRNVVNKALGVESFGFGF